MRRSVLCCVVVLAVLTGAAPAVAAPQRVTDVAYGPAPEHRLDIYPAASPSPAVVVVHGGGWSRGDKSAPGIVRRSRELQADGFAVFTINYRLVTDTRDGVPMQADDVASAVAWVHANGGRHGANVRDLNLLGGSAGGQLVSLAGQQINRQTPGRVDGIVSLSGPMDFVDTGPIATAQAGTMGRYLGCRFDRCTHGQKAGPSPIYNIRATSPPFLIINSENELVPADQARRMHQALLDAGIPSTLRIVSGSGHGMNLFPGQERTIVGFLNS